MLLKLGLFALMVLTGYYLGGLYIEETLATTPVTVTVATSTNPFATSTPKKVKKVEPPKEIVATSSEKTFKAYITGYTYWDNTPPGSALISNPVVHQYAGGTGTYQDPITLAVGHSFAGGTHTLDYPPGTKFYLPYLKKYFIVEDICGDGETPEQGPCHTGYLGYPWLDLWLGGEGGTREASDACARSVTGVHTISIDPKPTYEVVAGAVFNGECAKQFSDQI